MQYEAMYLCLNKGFDFSKHLILWNLKLLLFLSKLWTTQVDNEIK